MAQSILSPEERSRLYQLTQGAEPGAPAPQAAQNQQQPANQGWQYAQQQNLSPMQQGAPGQAPNPAAPPQAPAQQPSQQGAPGWSHAFAPNQVFTVNGVQMTGEKLVGMAQRGMDLSQREQEIQANQEKLEGAKVLDVALRSIPGFQDFCEQVIRDRRMPDQFGGDPGYTQAPTQSYQQAPQAPQAPAPAQGGEASGTPLSEIERIISAKLNPVVNSLQAMERNRRNAELTAWKQQKWQEQQARISNEMKGYPVFTQFSEAGKRLVHAELAQNPQAPVDAIVAKVAQLLHGNVQQELQGKVNHMTQTQDFRSGNGSGISPTQGGPKSYNWENFLKGDIRRAVNERITAAHSF